LVENLADIEALSLRCRSQESKSYIAEAIRCYRASAYRAAIVSTWIAVVFDLVDKIRELALAGDTVAKDLETRYETYIAQIEQGNQQGIQSALEFERNILDVCKDKLQFFDPQQFIDLVRLREDRHRCAHPSFQRVGVPYNPSAEQARLHIRNAIVYVLGQPPVQGKAALAELKALVSSDYFPCDDNKAITQLQTSCLANASEALVNSFVDQLVFGFLTTGDSLFHKLQVIAAINGVYELYPAIVEKRLAKQLNKAVRDVPDRLFSSATALVLYISSAWGVLDIASKDKLSNFIKDGPSLEVLGGLSPLGKVDELKQVVEERINSLNFEELDSAINTHEIGALGKKRALQFLSEVRSWNYANDVFSKLVLPLFNSLDREDILRIIRMPTETGADLLGSHGYRLFIDKVREFEGLEEQQLNQLLQENGAGYLVPQEENAW
jgi:hypothetical protein